jgi:hypothetical protein
MPLSGYGKVGRPGTMGPYKLACSRGNIKDSPYVERNISKSLRTKYLIPTPKHIHSLGKEKCLACHELK